jgi:SAM-dependent methyltransferase
VGGGLDYDGVVDRYAQDLDQAVKFVGRDHDFFARAKARIVLDVTQRRLAEPAAVHALDVGCGAGLLHPHLTGRLGSLAAVDVSPGVLERAAAANPGVRYERYDGDVLPFADASFDLALATSVVQVLGASERRRLVGELVRVVRPGGLVLVVEHNPLNPLTRLVVHRCSYGFDVEMLTRRALARLFEGAGLVVDESRYALVTPWDGPPALRLEQLLASVPLGAQYYVAGRVT